MKKLIPIFILVILVSALYLVAVEDIFGARFRFDIGGRDSKFSFYDVSIMGVAVFSGILTVISTMGYNRSKSRKLFMVSLAFFVFTVKSVFDIVFNHFIGGYRLLGVLTQGMELLVLIIFASVLLFKNGTERKKK